MKNEFDTSVIPLDMKLHVWKKAREQLEYHMKRGTYDFGICNGLHYAITFHLPPSYKDKIERKYSSIVDVFSELIPYKPKGEHKVTEFWWPTHKDSMLIRMEVVDDIIRRMEETINNPRS